MLQQKTTFNTMETNRWQKFTILVAILIIINFGISLTALILHFHPENNTEDTFATHNSENKTFTTEINHMKNDLDALKNKVEILQTRNQDFNQFLRDLRETVSEQEGANITYGYFCSLSFNGSHDAGKIELGEKLESESINGSSVAVSDNLPPPEEIISLLACRKGEKGEQGVMGVAGLKGEKGSSGTGGMKGAKGDSGGKGPQGIQGQKGHRGEQGLMGAAGSKGQKGLSGSNGVKGVKGDRGFRGLTGQKGQKGEAGMPAMMTGHWD